MLRYPIKLLLVYLHFQLRLPVIAQLESIIFWLAQHISAFAYLRTTANCSNRKISYVSLVVLSGSWLSQHQEPVGFYVSKCSRSDEGENPRGDPRPLPYQERLHQGGRRRGQEGERLGIWLVAKIDAFLSFCLVGTNFHGDSAGSLNSRLVSDESLFYLLNRFSCLIDIAL